MAIVVSALRGLRGARQRVSGVLAVTAQDWGFFFFRRAAERQVDWFPPTSPVLIFYSCIGYYGSLALWLI